jgi:2-phosphosulfolactate phosphatase
VEEAAPRNQSDYQVRFDWGSTGAAAIAVDADVVAWVDEVGSEPVPDGARVTGLGEAADFAQWCLTRQEQQGGRFRIAVVAAGATQADGSLRFTVEDLLAAGAVIDAIAEVGIDHQSPEAAAAAAAYTGLRNATVHLMKASVSARELRAAEARV